VDGELLQQIEHGKKAGKKVRLLDLGCGFGKLSRYLADLGFEVVACDFSDTAVEVLKSHSSNIEALVCDMTKGLPFENETFDVVVANLSLHYFCEKDTDLIVAEINRVLCDEGVLIGAVVEMREFKLVEGRFDFVELEPGFYMEDGKKHIRFFNKSDIIRFFGVDAGFEFEHLENAIVEHAGGGRSAWEFVVRKLK